MAKMIKSEMETTINMCGDSSIASIYTCQPKMRNVLNKLCRTNPEDCRLERSNGVDYWFSMSVDCIRFNPIMKPSEKQRAALAAARKIRAHKQDQV